MGKVKIKTEVINYLKSNISKTQLQSMFQKYRECHDGIISLDENKFTKEELLALVIKFRNGCDNMTDNYCRKLWAKGRENGYENINNICNDICPIWSHCIQNPSTHSMNNAYYILSMLWTKILSIKEKKSISESDKNEIKDLILAAKSNYSKVDNITNIGETW